MEKTKKYYNVKNIYLANAINYIAGARFYKFKNELGEEVFSFEDTEKFRETYSEIIKLKKIMSN